MRNQFSKELIQQNLLFYTEQKNGSLTYQLSRLLKFERGQQQNSSDTLNSRLNLGALTAFALYSVYTGLGFAGLH